MAVSRTKLSHFGKEQSVDLNLNGAFSAGSIRVERVNGKVTITQLSTFTFTTGSTASSTASLIPEWARPSLQVANIAGFGNRVTQMKVLTDGTLQLEFRDWTGALNTESSVSASLTLSYSVE